MKSCVCLSELSFPKVAAFTKQEKRNWRSRNRVEYIYKYLLLIKILFPTEMILLHIQQINSIILMQILASLKYYVLTTKRPDEFSTARVNFFDWKTKILKLFVRRFHSTYVSFRDKNKVKGK